MGRRGVLGRYGISVMRMKSQRVAVIGGGAAGLSCAAEIGRMGGSCVVFERMAAAGRKLDVTGGGRGNVGHLGGEDVFAEQFGKMGRFGVPAWRAMGGAEGLRQWLVGLGVEVVADEEGRLYPRSMRAADVREALEMAVRRGGGEFRCGRAVTDLQPSADGGWQVDGEEFGAVVLAAGGASAPTLGSDGSGFELARNVGHRVVPPVPGLAPLLLDEDWLKTNSGASVDHAVLRLRAGRESREVRGAVLATHRGLSGPAALAISGPLARVWGGKKSVRLELGLVPDGIDWEEARRLDGGRNVRRVLAAYMPKGLADGLAERCGAAADCPIARLNSEEIARLSSGVRGLELRIAGIAGFAESMVTCGGVDLRSVVPETLVSRLVPGLYFAGEVLDMDAPSGGWNLLWAFASGRLAGRSAAEAVLRKAVGP